MLSSSFLSVINLSLTLDMVIDTEKLINCRFEKNDKFYSYTNPEIIYKLINKALSHKRFEKEADDVDFDKISKITCCIWKNLNYTKTYFEFKNRIIQKKCF